jgi:hypothetical protein
MFRHLAYRIGKIAERSQQIMIRAMERKSANELINQFGLFSWAYALPSRRTTFSNRFNDVPDEVIAQSWWVKPPTSTVHTVLDTLAPLQMDRPTHTPAIGPSVRNTSLATCGILIEASARTGLQFPNSR